MEEKVTFGRFIARKRKERNLTQKELAEQLFVTESAVSKWERGVSYPDITLVAGICEALGITEHELIAGAEDVGRRTAERQAQKYRNLLRGWSWTFYILYGLSLAVCLVVNLAVSHRLSWFFIVLGAEAVAFSLTSLPLLLKYHTGLWTLCGFFASLCLLLAICCLYAGGDWLGVTLTALAFAFSVVFAPLVLRALPLPAPLYRHKTLLAFGLDTLLLFALLAAGCVYAGCQRDFWRVACPAALYSLLLPWGIMAFVRYAPVNGLFKTSLCLVWTGAWGFAADSVFRVIIDGAYFRLPPFDWSDWSAGNLSGNIVTLVFVVCLAAALLFAAGGIVWEIRRREPAKKQ